MTGSQDIEAQNESEQLGQGQQAGDKTRDLQDWNAKVHSRIHSACVARLLEQHVRDETRKMFRSGAVPAYDDDEFPTEALFERNPLDYVDETCIDCDLCRSNSPEFFTRHEDGGYTYVYRQPVTPEEVLQAEESRLACPTESIGKDGAEGR